MGQRALPASSYQFCTPVRPPSVLVRVGSPGPQACRAPPRPAGPRPGLGVLLLLRPQLAVQLLVSRHQRLLCTTGNEERGRARPWGSPEHSRGPGSVAMAWPDRYGWLSALNSLAGAWHLCIRAGGRTGDPGRLSGGGGTRRAWNSAWLEEEQRTSGGGAAGPAWPDPRHGMVGPECPAEVWKFLRSGVNVLGSQ